MSFGNVLMQDPTYVDTPNGIFTSGGTWFHTREETLQEYAGGVLTHTPLPRLLRLAEAWLRSPEVLALWALPVLLIALSPVTAAVTDLLVYLLWKAISPAFVSRIAARVFAVLENVYLTGLYTVITISYLAASDRFTAVWIGLAGFILFRWQIIAKVTDPLLKPIWNGLYPLPVSDQVLRALIVRLAIKFHVSLPALDRIEAQIRNTLNRNK